MTDHLFECVQYVQQIYPDDIDQWPENNRSAAYAARDRILKNDPGLKLVAERSHCIDSTFDRWPHEPAHLEMIARLGATHALRYEIRVDRG